MEGSGVADGAQSDLKLQSQHPMPGGQPDARTVHLPPPLLIKVSVFPSLKADVKG